MLKKLASLLLILGVASTLYDLALLRGADFAQDPVGAHRASSAREAYRWMARNLPGNAIVQANPDVMVEFFNGLWGHRQTVAVGEYYGTMYGVPIETYRPVHDQVAAIFQTGDRAAETCDRFRIDALVIADVDPIWQESLRWGEPLYANAHFRVIRPSTFPR